MFLHNMCGYGNCKEIRCGKCQHSKYYLVVEKREYKLPKLLNRIVTKFQK